MCRINHGRQAVAGERPSRYIHAMPYTRFDSERYQRRLQRLRQIPVRILVPNIITLLALCAGLTGIRLAIEERYELALGAIVFAAMLDAVDGRVARMIRGTSRFGAELDSLADFVNFGVAPGLILYFWGLKPLGNLGWIAAMVFAICAGLRLARFNVSIEDPNKPSWAGNFFTGMPAPAGAITVLLPVYLFFIGIPVPAAAILVYTLVIAALMISRLPVLSGKKTGTRVRPDLVLPVVVAAVLGIVLLVSYPWPVLTAGVVIYLACLPLGYFSYRRHEQEDAASLQTAAAPAQAAAPPSPPPVRADDERPARLN
jgi:CDP-diacylglycerol--serine O-phosphatidyltransferase